MVLTDSHHVPTTDTLTGNVSKSTNNNRTGKIFFLPVLEMSVALLFQVFVDVAEDDVGAGGEAFFGGEGHVGGDEAAACGEQQVVEG